MINFACRPCRDAFMAALPIPNRTDLRLHRARARAHTRSLDAPGVELARMFVCFV